MLSSALRARVVLRVVGGPHLRRSEVSRKSLRAASRSRNFSVSLSRYQDQPKDVYQKEQVGNAQLENEQGETQKKPPAISDFDIFSGSQGAANLIGAYNDVAFIINESTVYGSVALWEDLYMKWSPERPEDITPASLAWITLKYPVTSFLIIGVGKTMTRLDPKVSEYLRSHGIAFEILDTPNAIATWNFMLQEGRDVAAVLLSCMPYKNE